MNRLVLCLAAAVLLAGCGGQPPSAVKASTPAAHTPAPARAEPGPALPPAARRDSPAGARAFATYFIELHNHAMRTGDTADLRGVLAPECFMCLTMPALIESAYHSGGRIEGGLWLPTAAVTTMPSSQGAPDGMAFLQLRIHLEPMKTFSAADQLISSLEGSTHDRTLLIWTSWLHGRWYVDQVNGVSGQML